ncbi:MAG: hypothetical protein DDT19_00692 [Syntrophomonadaceae bacterium]|nr:hypothetical protein [Bacillota bacterium]
MGKEKATKEEKATKKVRARVPGIVLDTGEEGSRSAYIRQEFLKDRSRAELAAELNVPYYVVYSATTNMFNKVHPETVGRTGGGIRGVMIEDPETGEIITRADAMRKMFAAGKTRTEIKEHFDSPYATVYAATKDMESPEGTSRGRRAMVEDIENPGELIARTDLIRRLYNDGEGMTRREIADALKCDYSVVWATIKNTKDEEDVDVEDVEDEEATDEGIDIFVE